MTPSSETEVTLSSTTRDGRQRLGAACEECRRRKLRCDGQQPQCGICQESNLVCEVTQRGIRGPKKGVLKALRDRVAELEAMLASRPDLQQQQLGNPASSSTITIPTPPLDVSDATTIDHTQSRLPAPTTSVLEPEMLIARGAQPDSSSSSESSRASTLPRVPNIHMHISSVVQAEL